MLPKSDLVFLKIEFPKDIRNNRNLAAVTAACCFPKSVSDRSLSLVPCRLYWPCLKVCNWGESFSTGLQAVPDEKEMSRRRRKKSASPLLLPGFPQVPVPLPPEKFSSTSIFFLKFPTLDG